MRRRFAALIAAAVLVGLPVAQSSAHPVSATTTSVAAKPCSSGYKHAVIGGAHKCLRRGQYCARRYDRQYHRYGYHCHKRDRNGDYHLQ